MSIPFTIGQWAVAALFLYAAGYAVISDFRSLQIPNWTSLVIVLAFPPAALLAKMDPATAGLHLVVGAVLFAVCALFFARGFMGGGDAKLLAAIGVWPGPYGIGSYLIVVALLGGLLVLVGLILRRLPLPGSLASVPWLRRDPDAPQLLPYGVAIGLGAYFLFFFYPDFPVSWDRLTLP
jgi:prepilin peptidase CpaA